MPAAGLTCHWHNLHSYFSYSVVLDSEKKKPPLRTLNPRRYKRLTEKKTETASRLSTLDTVNDIEISFYKRKLMHIHNCVQRISEK